MTATLDKSGTRKRAGMKSSRAAKSVNLPSKDHSLILNAEAVAAGIQHDLDDKGIAKTAREEKIRARNETIIKKAAEDAKMEKLYREVILKEKPIEPGFVPVDMLGGIKPSWRRKREKPVEKKETREEVGSFGD